MKISLIITYIYLAMLIVSCSDKHQSSEEVKLHDGKLYARGSLSHSFASEAKMTFSYFIEVKKSEFEINKSFDSMRDTFETKIEAQIQHLFGSFKTGEYKGVPKLGENQTIVLDPSSIRYVANSDVYSIKYKYSGVVLLDNEFGSHISIALPRNPDLIYKQALSNLSQNPCTDEHYNSENDFWYFWDAKKSTCSTIKPGVHFDFVKMIISRQKNTVKTYPEYDRLIRTDKNGKRFVNFYAFFGYPEEMKKVSSNLKGVEYTKDIFDDTNKYLKRNGYLQTGKKRLSPVSLIYTYEKYFPKTNLTMKFNLFVGNIGIEEAYVESFHRIYKQALESSSLIYYGGHSGLGGNLDLESIESNVGKIEYDVSNYQIIFFDSCSSFPYYSEMYFNKKKNERDVNGIKNLDIISNGLSAYFVRNSASITTFLRTLNNAFLKNKLISYQELIDDLQNNQMKADSELHGHIISVGGDEDNPTVAPSIIQETETISHTSITKISLLKSNLEQQNYKVTSNNHLLLEKKMIAEVRNGAIAYGLNQLGQLTHLVKNDGKWSWKESEINSISPNGFTYMTHIKLPENNAETLYLVSTDGGLYTKEYNKPISLSIRQHPYGGHWIEIKIVNHDMVAVDQNYDNFKWDTQRKTWIQ